MKQKDLTKIFMIIFNCKNPLVFMVDTKIFQRFKGQGPRRLSTHDIVHFFLILRLKK